MRQGDRVGKYRLQELLGTGGFCESWLGEHVELKGHQAALKIALDPDYRELLRREGLILAQLHHRAIVRVLDIELAGDPPHVVQEYIPGRSLRALLGQGPLDHRLALDLFRELLEALDHAHRAGVVHRDIKPENLIVDHEDRLHVLDFGLGKVEEQAARNLLLAHSMRTSLGTSLAGTLQYMSPEQRSGAAVDQRADLYAAGIVLFELLTGRQPALNDHPGGAPALDRIYQRLVAPLERRYPSAGAVLDDIELVAEEQDLPVLPVASPAAPVEAELRQRLEQQQAQIELHARELEQLQRQAEPQDGIVCTQCRGTGQIRELFLFTRRCPYCGGRGSLPDSIWNRDGSGCCGCLVLLVLLWFIAAAWS